MAYYSDNGVDESLVAVLPEFGYAVDVGANNGVFNSNTLHYEEKGWLVLCIEANPKLAEEGRARRKLWRDVACGEADGEDEFWMMGTSPWASHSALSSGGTQIPYGGNPATEEQKVRVQVRRLDRVIEEAGFPRVDYLTIDTEGWEQKVLAGFTIERWKPLVIVVEQFPENRMEPPAGYTLHERRVFDNVYLRSPNV